MRWHIVLLGIFISFGCGKKQVDSNQSKLRRLFLRVYNEKWNQYTIRDQALVKKVSDLLSSRDFKVIWNWDTDGDGVVEYFCVLPDPSIKKGITEGILIDAIGKVKLLFDVNKGMYTRNYSVYDFKRMGILPGEIKCFRLLFKNNEMVFSRKYAQSYSTKFASRVKKRLYAVHIFSFQLIDQDDHLFGIMPEGQNPELFQYESFFVEKAISIRPPSVRWGIMNPMGESEALIYSDYRKMCRLYRKSKMTNRVKVYNE